MPRLTDRTAWILWGVLFAVVCGLIVAGNKKTVTHNYFLAAEHWLAGEDLYDGTGEGFIYFPQTAVLCLPLAPLPPVGREIVWRVFMIGVFAAGTYRLCKFAEAIYERPFFPLTTLVAIPLAWSSARNGQATLGIAGLTMLAFADLAEKRWWRATAWLTLGVAVKPLMIVPALLSFVHRPMIPRVVAGLAILAAIPYVAQSPAYVNSQMIASVQMLKDAGGVSEDGYWAQFYGVIRVLGYHVPQPIQTGGRLIAALATLVAVYLAARKTQPQQAAIFGYAFAAAYILLFNPRTENNTYSFIAPAIGLFFTHAWLVRHNQHASSLLAAVAVGTVGSFEIGRLFTDERREAIWLAPTMCVVFTTYVAFTLRQTIRENIVAKIAAAEAPAKQRRAA